MNLVFIPRSVDRVSRRSVTWVGLAHMLGAGLGGGAVFALVGLIGATAAHTGVDEHALLAVGTLTLAATASRSQWRGEVKPLPERKGQVPRIWVSWRHQSATAFAFGVLLGMGFLTFLEVASLYLVLLAALLSQNVLLATVIGAVYGLSRGSTLVAAIRSAARSSAPGEAAEARARELSRVARRALPAATSLAVVLIGIQDIALLL
ncbi:MAG TPA: hypothetical protein VFM96_13305 [Gaiellaceae bacterium]|nr:hypothetical protein [Gaiellaceae bacterium]